MKLKVWAYIEQYNFCISFMPKVANTSMKVCIADGLGLEPWYNEYGHGVHAHGHFNMLTTEEAQKLDCPKFAFVRNPIDRVVSTYVDKVLDKKCRAGYYKRNLSEDVSFEGFVNHVCSTQDSDGDHHFINQSYLLGDVECAVYKYEDITEGWDAVRKMIPGLWGLSHLNAYNENLECVSITEEIRDKLNERFKADLERFNYGG